MSRLFHAPRRWLPNELETARVRSEKNFRELRMSEGPEKYRREFDTVEPDVRNALALTKDLLGLDAGTLISEDRLWGVLRYFCGPQVSEEDFWTLVGRKFKKITPDVAAEAAAVIKALLDPRRAPWVVEDRPPTESERDAAILATATLLAHESLRTSRRGEAARTQEDEVAEALLEAGYHQLSGDERKPIDFTDDVPRGSFSREQKIAGAKCDVPARLHDGRLLAIECKVSNGPKNGWKRLLREIGGKSDTWRQQFGSQLVTAAVIAGVYDLKCLERAQEEHSVAIFWQHDLGPLREFVKMAR